MPLQQQFHSFLAQICCRHSRQQLKQLCPDNLQAGSASPAPLFPATPALLPHHLRFIWGKKYCASCASCFVVVLIQRPSHFGMWECAGQGQPSLGRRFRAEQRCCVAPGKSNSNAGRGTWYLVACQRMASAFLGLRSAIVLDMRHSWTQFFVPTRQNV